MDELLGPIVRLLLGLFWRLADFVGILRDARKTFRRRDYSVDPDIYRRHDERAALARRRRGHEPHP